MKKIILLLILPISFSLSGQTGPDLEIDLPILIQGQGIPSEPFAFTIASNFIKTCEATSSPAGDGCAPVDALYKYKKVIYFGTKVKNITSVNFDVGSPPNVGVCSSHWEFSTCHGHQHMKFYEFKLFGFNSCQDALLPLYPNVKSKFGACLASGNCGGQNHTCADQGVSAGCSDTYGYDIDNGSFYNAQDCQFLYIEDLPEGKYILRVKMNINHSLTGVGCPILTEYSYNANPDPYENNTAYYIFDYQNTIFTLPATLPPPNLELNPPAIPDHSDNDPPNYGYIDKIYPHSRLYVAHTIPETLSLENKFNQLLIENLVDLLVPNPYSQNIMTIARKTIKMEDIGNGGVTLNDNQNREIVAGDEIRLLPGTTISGFGGGNTRVYINSCLSTGTFKTAPGEGLFVENETNTNTTANPAPSIKGEEFGFEVKPNPSGGHFSISMDEVASQARNDVVVVDMLGQVVFAGGFEGSKTTVDLSKLPQGIYSLGVNGFRQRVVIQR